MSTEETQSEINKKGINLNIKVNPITIVLAIIAIISNIVLVVRFADSKTSREDVKEIVNSEMRIMNEGQRSIIETLGEMKMDIRFLKGETNGAK